MGKVLGVIAGLIVMFVVFTAAQLAVIALHPVPAGVDPRDQASIAGWVATMPVPAQLATLAAWLAAAFGGGWVAMLISRWSPGAWIVAGLTAAMALNQTIRASYPAWLMLGAVAAPLIGGWLAIRLGFRAADPIDG